MKKRISTPTKLFDSLISEGWRTPDTYSRDYESFPDAPGVYLFVLWQLYPHLDVKEDTYDDEKIIYVGKTLNIRKRQQQHEVMAAIYNQIEHGKYAVTRFFMALPECEIHSTEIELIKKYNPPFNLQHRTKVL